MARKATKAQITRICKAINRKFPDVYAKPFTWDDYRGWMVNVGCNALDIDYAMAGDDSIPVDMFLEPINDGLLGLYFA